MILRTVALMSAAMCIPASAQTSAEFANKGRVLFSAFQCSYWAGVAKKENEAERLFTLGYESGNEFFAAVIAKKITPEDMSSKVPVGIGWHTGGPTIEFSLGRIYGAAIEDAEKKVKVDTTDMSNWEAARELNAATAYQDANCQLLGM